MYKLYIELKKREPYHEIAVKTYLQDLILILTKKLSSELNQSKIVYDKNFKNLEKLRNVFSMVERNYNQKITLKSAAEVACISIPYFCRIFKKITHSTFISYLLKVRVDKAKELLFENNLSILDIAYKVGFNNISHFYRIFKKFTSMSPNEFRKKLAA
jgi:YesN/AraC family two-component response regulator